MDLKSFLSRFRARLVLNIFFVFVVLGTLIAGYAISRTLAHSASSQPLTTNQTFTQASQATGVPVELLKALCYTEGRLSNNGGVPSEDNGFGCMHLVKSLTADTLDQAATDLNVSVNELKQDMNTNIRGGAAVLHDEALQLSSNHTLPTNLANWYGTLTVYSAMSIPGLAQMFANEVYQTIQQGFSGTTDLGESVTLAAEAVQPNTATIPVPTATSTPAATPTQSGPTATPAPAATPTQPNTTIVPAPHAAAKQPDSAAVTTSQVALPSTCVKGTTDSNVDYPGAVDCILTPVSLYDCNALTSPSNCNYTSSDRPTSCSVLTNINPPQTTVTQPCDIDQIVIHDTESATVSSALSVFECLGSSSPPPTTCEQSSVQYIVDTDGTVYQVLHEQDIAYHDGNFWSNMHSIGIEHVGYDANGYKYYSAAEYAASAKLVAYLLKKYHLPLNRDHVVAHGTVPSPTVPASPNHFDPGPYWMWDYYFNLISQQGVSLSTSTPLDTITLHPKTDQNPNGATSADYNFFKLYNGPSTKSGLIPAASPGDPTDTSYNVEPGMSYYYLAKVQDAAGTGDTMYEIWYGEKDQANSYFADAKLAWLAVPAGDGVAGGQGQKPGVFYSSPLVEVVDTTANIYGEPVTDSQYIIGDAPVGAIFYSGYTVTEDNTSNLWYEINYNHRYAWVPASEIALTHP